jgi:hypothetical protein
MLSGSFLRSIVKDNIQQRTVDAQFAVVFDESQFAESIHEEADPGPGGANHLRQGDLNPPSAPTRRKTGKA